MTHFLDQNQKNMVNFSISIFCNVLVFRPLCSNLGSAPSRKMIKIQGKYFWKLDSDIFPTICGTYFITSRSFQLIF